MKLLTVDTYYDQDEYMSVSEFKRYQKCQMYGKTGFVNNPTKAMLIGSYVDAYVEGTLEDFKTEHPEIFAKTGATKGQAKSDYKNADEICKFIDNDKIFSQFMSGEKQVIMTGEIKGIPFKIKMDSYSKGIAINDLKVMGTVTNSNGDFYDFITPWGYDIQLACYQEIVRQNTGEQLPCFICAVTKETPINSVIVNIPQDYLNKALYLVESLIEDFYKIKMGEIEPIGCGICATCISNRTTTPIISLEDLLNV